MTAAGKSQQQSSGELRTGEGTDGSAAVGAAPLELLFVVPMYNSAASIGLTLGSLRTLSDIRWHAVVVDDGSTDGGAGADLVREVMAYEPRVSLLSKPNGGLGSARNFGMDHAAKTASLGSEFVIFLDADDIFLSWNIFETLELARERGMSVCGGFRTINTDGAVIDRVLPMGNALGLAELLALQFVVTHCLLHRWTDVMPHRFAEDGRLVEDYEMWFRMAHAGVRWACFPAVVCEYLVRRRVVGPSGAKGTTTALSGDFARVLGDGQHVLRQAFASARAAGHSELASGQAEQRALGKQKLTWATRAAICWGSEHADQAATLLRESEGTPERGEDGIAGAIHAAVVYGLGQNLPLQTPDARDAPASWNALAHAIVTWCGLLERELGLPSGLAGRTAKRCDVLGDDVMAHTRKVLELATSRAGNNTGSLTIFGFGQNGRRLATVARGKWGGLIRIRDTRLSPDRPDDAAQVPPDMHLEAWDSPVSPHTTVICSIGDDALALSTAPLSALVGENTPSGPRVTRWTDAELPEPEPNYQTLLASFAGAVRVPTSTTLRVRIVMVCSEKPAGGVQAKAVRLCRELPALGIDCGIYLIGGDIDHDQVHEEMVQLADRIGRTNAVFHAHVHGHPAEALAVSMIELADCDVLIAANDDLAIMAALAVAFATSGRTKVVLLAATDDPYNRDLHAQYPIADGVLAVSQPCADWAGRTSVRREDAVVAVVPTGAPMAASARKPTPGQLRVAFVGRLDENQKRSGDVAVIARLLHERKVNCRIDVIGEGPDALRLERACEGLPRSIIRLMGGRDHAWVLDNLRSYDVLLSTSAAEGLSTAMQEAMGQGVVPVVTDLPGNRQALVGPDGIEETQGAAAARGVLFAVGDCAAAAAEIASLTSDRARLGKLATSAHAFARQEYSDDQVVLRTAAFVREVAALTPRPPAESLAAGLTERQWPRGAKTATMPQLTTIGAMRLEITEGPARAYGMGLINDVLARHSAVVAKHAVLVPGGLRSISPQRAEQWRAQGRLVIDLHGLLNRDVSMRYAAALGRLQEAVMARGGDDGGRLGQRVVIYGAGAHTRHLLEKRALGREVVAFADDRAGESDVPRELVGVPVVQLDEALGMLVDGIIVSSDAHELAMVERALTVVRSHVSQGSKPVAVLGLYVL